MTSQPQHSSGGHDATTATWFDHASARWTNTDAVTAASLKAQYPALELVITQAYSVDLLAYAAAGHADATPIEDGRSAGDSDAATVPSSLAWKFYVPPSRRIDGSRGAIGERLLIGRFEYRWAGETFLVYLVEGRDGNYPYGEQRNYYILATDRRRVDQLILEAGQWAAELHDEVWVFDGGRWDKSAELYRSVMKASWENVILDERMKKSIIDDHLSFFQSRHTYDRLSVPWKRGVIYHGPPGNGKTISVKAMMHTLYDLKSPVPTMYVRSLASFAGPEYSIKQIFARARMYAPCYLVFEDLDSLITDQVRSYFLNEVDGLKSNDGIFMVGSTNHLDRLDPGISKRPSRFDRKYFFPDPDRDQRVAYCRFWQAKLQDNDEVEFPDKLCRAVADITDRFSFAYMQEAFVAALLAIARRSDDDAVEDEQTGHEVGDGWIDIVSEDEDLDDLVLWIEIKKQVKILREGMEEGDDQTDETQE